MSLLTSPYRDSLRALLVEASPDASLLIGRDGRLEAANDLAYALLRRRHGTILGCTLEDLTDPSERDTVPVSAVGTGQDGPHLHYRQLLRGDGTTVAAEIASRELESHEVLCSIRVVPGRRTTVKALEHGVQSASGRTVPIRNVCRQVRTLLNGVLGMTELLADTSLDDEQLEYVHTIRECGEPLLNVVFSILECVEHPERSAERGDDHAAARAPAR